ncbi:winged helix DNA-binding protein [Candidatus Dojkabacteria bacterium]|nr:winged helix DNA-binding protein [Candidatus Dojkabacteria bacterium]
MYKPIFTITTELMKTLNEIERLYGRLEGMQIPRSLLLNLERDNLVQSSFSSNSIEGNPLSHAEVTNLLLDGRVAVNRDEKEVKNYFDILKSLPDRVNEDFNVDLVLDIHSKLLSGVDNDIRGKIRDKKVVVGHYNENREVVVKHEPPTHMRSEIFGHLKDLTGWVSGTETQPVLKAGLFHHQFVYIHPFEDGNGRVCRLSTALIFLRSKYQINRYFVLDDYYDVNRDNYSDKLNSADKGDKTEWLQYFAEGVMYSLRSALSKIQVGLDRVRVDMRPTPKEKKVLDIVKKRRELTSSELAKELDVSRQQSFYLLRGLVEKGYVEKIGSTKNSYYRIV